jgi:hypothetical protein
VAPARDLTDRPQLEGRMRHTRNGTISPLRPHHYWVKRPWFYWVKRPWFARRKIRHSGGQRACQGRLLAGGVDARLLNHLSDWSSRGNVGSAVIVASPHGGAHRDHEFPRGFGSS